MQADTLAGFLYADAPVPSGNDDVFVSRSRIKRLEDAVAMLEASLRDLDRWQEYDPEAKLDVELKETSAFDPAEASHPLPPSGSVDDHLDFLTSHSHAGFITTSERLAHIWLSSGTIPHHLLIHGITDIEPHPFATTPSSNISQGMMGSTAVALKAFRRSQTQPVSEEEVKRFFFEALVSSTAMHRNILPVLGMHIGPSGDIYLVSKLMRNGPLPDHLAAHPSADKLLLLTKVADAVAYLHSLPTPILHGDVRGPNIVVGDDGEPFLIDFGFALVMDPVTSEFSPASHFFAGNARWTPNEKIRPCEYPLTLKADSFSFASLMLEVFTGDVPYSNLLNDGAVIIEVLVRKKLPARPHTPQLTDSLWELMTKCWSLDPAARPSMEEIHRSLLAEMATTPLA